MSLYSKSTLLPVRHGFFGRQGGQSTGIYDSLNCGWGTDDHSDLVTVNRTTVAACMGIDFSGLFTLNQIHSNICLYIDKPYYFNDRPEGDSMVTDKAGIALGVLTADCAPVLFSGKKADGTPVIGAAHAGWGGAVKGVLENTVAMMKEQEALPETIKAAIGPCIGPTSYEVSDSFLKPFLAQDEGNGRFFCDSGKEGHKMFDLPSYVGERLRMAGVAEFETLSVDTYSNENDYFSYRRATHRNEQDYGRQISVVVIE